MNTQGRAAGRKQGGHSSYLLLWWCILDPCGPPRTREPGSSPPMYCLKRETEILIPANVKLQIVCRELRGCVIEALRDWMRLQEVILTWDLAVDSRQSPWVMFRKVLVLGVG